MGRRLANDDRMVHRDGARPGVNLASRGDTHESTRAGSEPGILRVGISVRAIQAGMGEGDGGAAASGSRTARRGSPRTADADEETADASGGRGVSRPDTSDACSMACGRPLFPSNREGRPVGAVSVVGPGAVVGEPYTREGHALSADMSRHVCARSNILVEAEQGYDHALVRRHVADHQTGQGGQGVIGTPLASVAEDRVGNSREHRFYLLAT